jgi:hypothetical protein
MKLTELEAKFIKATPTGSQDVATLVEADGIIFLCPKCFIANDPKGGIHSVICWFVGKVPDDRAPRPGRWTPSGTGLHDLTFIPPPDAVSVHLTGPGCGWHGHIRNGEATLS